MYMDWKKQADQLSTLCHLLQAKVEILRKSPASILGERWRCNVEIRERNDSRGAGKTSLLLTWFGERLR